MIGFPLKYPDTGMGSPDTGLFMAKVLKIKLLANTPKDSDIHIREAVLQSRLFIDELVNDTNKSIARRARHYRNTFKDKVWLFFHPEH